MRNLLKKSLLVHLLSCVILLGFVTNTQAQGDRGDLNKSSAAIFINAAYNNNDLSLMDAIFAENYAHHPGGYDTNWLRIRILGLRAAMPDLRVTPILQVAEGDWVAMQLLFEGTFTNDLIFQDGTLVPPSNQPVQFLTNMVFHFNEFGQIYEHWQTLDHLNYLSQLDVLEFEPIIWQGPLEPLSPATNTSTEELIRSLATQYYETFSNKNIGNFNSLLADSFMGYNPFGSFDRAGQIQDLTSLFTAFPDLAIRIDAMMVEGDYVAVLYNMNGTFTQNFSLADGNVMPATGNPLDLIRIDFLHFNQANTIDQTFEIYDGFDFMFQLGLLIP